jgi:alanyl-tRNA synthetase
MIVATMEGWDAPGLKAIATAAIAGATACVVLASSGPSSAIVIGRSKAVPIDANAILQQLIGRFGGRGGGTSELAQGGGWTEPPSDIVTAARTLVESALR